MLWDDENLYIAFKTIDRNIQASRTQGMDVFNDCVNSFTVPDGPHI